MAAAPPGLEPLTSELDLPAALADAVDASVLHGTVCGLICGCTNLSDGAAIRDLARLLHRPLDPDDVLLGDYITACREALAADDFSFTPIVAQDPQDIEQRLVSLQSWAEAFMAGFELSSPDLDEAAEDALEDIGAIGLLDTDLELDDDAEDQFIEVAEHLKVAVLLLHDSVRNAIEGEADAPE